MQNKMNENGKACGMTKKPVQDNPVQVSFNTASSQNLKQQELYSQVFAFLGNSFLSPMSQTSSIGLEEKFWNEFPDFESESVVMACKNLEKWAIDAKESLAGLVGAANTDSEVSKNDAAIQKKAVQAVSVEFTRLFVGPPKPAAYPWETFYRAKEVTSGFGRATLEMKQALQKQGLKVGNKNNQYEDHIGIELLYLSKLCSKTEALTEEDMRFIKEHPGSWIADLHEAIKEEAPQGYFDHLTALTRAVLENFEGYLVKERIVAC